MKQTYLQWLISKRAQAKRAYLDAVKVEKRDYKNGVQDDDNIYARHTTEAELDVWTYVLNEYRLRFVDERKKFKDGDALLNHANMPYDVIYSSQYGYVIKGRRSNTLQKSYTFKQAHQIFRKKK